MQEKYRILLSRTDSIGDVILTLPMAGVIKERYPEAKIFFLGRNYTKDIVAACDLVDEFISYDDLIHVSEKEQISKIKSLSLTHCIHVFPRPEIAKLMKKASVPNRIGTTNRFFHWFTCTKLVKLSRKNSDLHESQLNCKLLKPLGIDELIPLHKMHGYLSFQAKAEVPDDLVKLIDNNKTNVILHPKSQGSAREWGFENFGKLIELLPEENYTIFVSGTEKEGQLVQPLLQKYPHLKDITGSMDLAQFISFINRCDVLVAASTGPLHIAAALGIHAIGLFPSVRPMHPGRWQPIGRNAAVVLMKEDCKKCRENGNCVCGGSDEANKVYDLIKKIR